MYDAQEWIYIILFWVICGLIAGYLYRQKGRSLLIGCIGGVILGPLGILLASVTPPNRDALARREERLEQEELDKGQH